MASMDAQLYRNTRIQVSKLAFYWAVLTIAFAVLWTVLIHTLELTGIGAALTLAVPVLMGGLAAFGLYRIYDHQTFEYDETGYRILKGRKNLEKHDWSEFKECSLIKDSYAMVKVRVYVEREGEHIDIDPSSSGISPYSFRDILESHIRNHGNEQNFRDDVFDGLEREIQSGRASWVADLTETVRRYQISGESFPLIARGGTRPKGFMLSRFFAFTMMPDYRVCLYACDAKGSGADAKSNLMRLIRIIETQRDEKDIKWSWLLLFSEHGPSESLSKTIQSFGNKDVGIGCIDVNTGQIVTSPNQLGMSLRKQMRFDKLIKDLRKKRELAS